MLIGRSPRMVTWAPCTLFADGAAYAAMCTDISATGARIRFSENFVPPSRCRIVSAQLGLHREARLSRTNGLDAAYYFAD
ncbi:PilZ domain-containing protein [Hyphomonas sp.]|uniref:PilZ domain-containing protein n=1 Tax=Hyphomonas sp. TaxID=87 RepID=UPI00391BFC5E